MIVIQDGLEASDLPQGGIATIGNYDGLHLGQCSVIDRIVGRARELGRPALLITFEPHPFAVLRPESVPARLLTAKQREVLLERAGVDALVELRFTPELARTPAEEFLRGFLGRNLAVHEVYVGEGFGFGHRREGDLGLLQRVGRDLGFSAEAVTAVSYRGERISATRIRYAVAEGRLEEAAEMLGRPYSIVGKVARGDRMGRRLGWPTMNLEVENELIPADGVYAGQVRLSGFPASFDCATNVGTRPTVYENYRRVVESHILDFSSDVYGQGAEVSFCKRLREERIFPTIMDLSAQIRQDVETTREYFAARRRFDRSPVSVPE